MRVVHEVPMQSLRLQSPTVVPRAQAVRLSDEVPGQTVMVWENELRLAALPPVTRTWRVPCTGVVLFSVPTTSMAPPAPVASVQLGMGLLASPAISKP